MHFTFSSVLRDAQYQASVYNTIAVLALSATLRHREGQSQHAQVCGNHRLCASIDPPGAGIRFAARAFDLRDDHALVAGQQTESFVLATPHLSMTPANFNAAALEGLLQKLRSFDPGDIAMYRAE
ncbi:MAG: hypothetical protein FP825_05070 [Hyphomonas sp.]|uniref:hypothetical protein n=1 Tax=Hyphomonas sp. TaxID=87 RepID=UPI0017FD752A|nr:hypothetical protein [Hyphomonas sp.]MBA3067838.1 hypothetical protein [Hyphomonas sp.]MBU3919945.1 hypothetical protein [Alphaproteobacteria bacterium]MBU4062394.1 hypothetical protein [Alphaproteobacteria bacterium]MBU4165998.1 hypothetical protein [Alphaproteobacteria bacterium]